MRTIGPGSIASLLKIALDVAYAVLWAVLVIMVVAFAAALLALRSWPATLMSRAI